MSFNMSEIRREKYRRREDSNEGNLNFFLFIAFWLSLFVECLALYKRYYHIYTAMRLCIIPILTVRILLEGRKGKINVFFYISLLISYIADLLTIFGNMNTSFVGVNLYTLSYIGMGCYYNSIKHYHNYSHWLFIILSVLVGIATFSWVYNEYFHSVLFWVQTSLHIGILLFMLLMVIKLRLKLKGIAVNYLMLSSALVIITSIIYGLDVLYFKRRYAFVDAMVGLGNGLYLYVLTKGALGFMNKNINKSYSV
jgi:hypothetical protein